MTVGVVVTESRGVGPSERDEPAGIDRGGSPPRQPGDPRDSRDGMDRREDHARGRPLTRSPQHGSCPGREIWTRQELARNIHRWSPRIGAGLPQSTTSLEFCQFLALGMNE